MRLVPDKQDERIEFFQTKLAVWQAHAAELGLNETELADLAAAVEATRVAQQEAHVARQMAQAATLSLKLADKTMSTMGAAALFKIRGAARLAGDGVYPIAQIPVPAQASPIGAPGGPVGFEVKLMTLGWVELTWRCRQPRGAVGTMYQVYRKLREDGPFEYIGTAGERKYVDTTVPAGTPSVTYKVRAVRSTTAGPWRQFIVNFGTSETTMATFTPEGSKQLAA